MADYYSFPGLLAGEDLSSSQYLVVKMASTAGEVIHATGGTDTAIGILQNDPADGEAADVAIMGVAYAKAADAVTAGTMLNWDSTGRVKASATNTSGVIGMAPLAAGAANDLIPVIVTGFWHQSS